MKTRRRPQASGKPRPGVLLAIECLEPRRAPAAFIVTSAMDPTDPGKVTLRDAINMSNATPGPNTITFDIAGGGTEQTINLASPLPALIQPVEIFGGTQTSTTYQHPGIVLNGAGAGAGDGFDVNAGNSTIEGFVVENFTGHGVALQQSGNDEVIDDCIGTNSLHTGAAPNTKDGVFINNVADNAVQNCIVSGNDLNGIEITGASAQDNLIGSGPTANAFVGTSSGGGNYIGVNYYADGAIPNLADGVLIHAGASGTTVTGDVISGNGQNGVHITGTGDVPQGMGTYNNTVTSNMIGTDGTGEFSVANGGDGVLIDGGANLNQIGTDAPGEGNIISGNTGNGVHLTGTGAGPANMGTSGNSVLGNLIGIDIAGTAALPNGNAGVVMDNGANGNTIGDGSAGGMNVISGNTGDGVLLDGSMLTPSAGDVGTSNNSVIENYIGTDTTGTMALGNGGNGVHIDHGAFGNTIGADTSHNVISANGGAGVYIAGIGAVAADVNTHGNTLLGNYIGLDETGGAPLGNMGAGVLIDNGANGNNIGDGTAGGANTISANQASGIHLDGNMLIPGTGEVGTTNNMVLFNFIGTDSTGMLASGGPGPASLGNSMNGVLIDNGAYGNTIGADGSHNVISNNGANGVYISGYGAEVAGVGTTGNNLIANYIGTNANGSAALANGNEGVLIDNGASDNTIGDGTAAGANVISGNLGDGVHIDGSNLMPLPDLNEIGTDDNSVLRNIIGLDATGQNALANLGNGVLIDHGAQSNQIGAQGKFNVISANFGNGIEIDDEDTSLNTVQNNYIGTDIGGTMPNLGNLGDGIFIDGAPGNTIGGSNMEQKQLLEGNLISGNEGNGIEITGASASGNFVRGNFIGTTLNGTAALANLSNGVLIDGAPGNVIGNALTDTGKDYRNVISGNGENGVSIIDGANGNFVVGDFIGTDVNGAVPIGNMMDGVSIADSPNTMISNVGTVPGCVISGNLNNGVEITGAASVGTQVLNALIGVNFNGNAAVANSGDGIVIDDGSQTKCINDVISGNDGNGVHITGVSATANLLQSCSIGVDGSNTMPLGNGGDGVLIDGNAFANMVGNGTTHNTIVANDGNGVEIDGILTLGNLVQGNYIGVNVNSTVMANHLDGVYLGDGAFQNTIGGAANPTPGHGVGNVISGNGRNGVEINGALTDQNNVAGNLIGTDTTGALRVFNAVDGVLVTAGASGNIIGAAGFGSINIISGNGTYGIEITGAGTSGNIVQNNSIGVNLAGGALGNGNDGVIISNGATANMIGQVGAGLDNIISNNTGNGVEISGMATAGNMVVNNFIGTGGGGVGGAANMMNGVYINNAPRNTIGGGAGAANVISANMMNGVEISGANAAGNTVNGNLIGTDVTGGVALGNVMDGVKIDNGASFNNVGAAGQGNVIAANTQNGVEIAGLQSNLNNVLANFIGTNPAGAAGLGNKMNGVFINAAPLNSIGAAGAGNTICGNTLNGVLIAGPVAGPMNTNVLANFIGVTAGGAALGNQMNGVAVSLASSNFIGGAGAGNTIGSNGKNGVDIISGTENLISQNSISNSGGIGIDLGNNGVTLNTPGGPHVGANDLQNFPVITGAVAGAKGTTVTLSLNGTPGHTFSIEIFSNAAPNPTGFGEGQIFIVAAPPAVTDANGNVTVTLQNLGIPAGAWVTATATDITAGSAQANDTSEFSAAVKVQDANPPTVDNVTFVTVKGKTTGVDLFFNEALTAASVTKSSVELFSAGPHNSFTTPIALAKTNPIVYNATTDTVILNTAKPIAAGAFIKVFVNGTTMPVTDLDGTPLDGEFTGTLPSGNGTPGGDFDALVAHGTKLTYTDAHSNTVTISLAKGGTMELIRTTDGQGQYLELANVIANKTILSGTVKKGKTGTGSTALQGITGLDGATDKLQPPQFVVGNPNLGPLIALSSWEEDLLAPWNRDDAA